MGVGVKIDGAKVGVAAFVVKGEEGVIGVVPFTRGVAEICVCSWTGFVPSGIESSFRLYVKNLFCSCMYCRALSYSPMSVQNSSLSIFSYSASVTELLEESLSSAALDIAAAPERCWLLSHRRRIFLHQVIHLFAIYNCPECLALGQQTNNQTASARLLHTV